MKKQKYYINLTDQERSEILSSLLIKKNKLTHQGKFTDGIDEVICKLMKLCQFGVLKPNGTNSFLLREVL